jgi:hypothetical protein
MSHANDLFCSPPSPKQSFQSRLTPLAADATLHVSTANSTHSTATGFVIAGLT